MVSASSADSKVRSNGGRQGDSHHFWTVGKDGLLKHWDGDNFQMIQQLEGHHGEVWALRRVTAARSSLLPVPTGPFAHGRRPTSPLPRGEREREMERASRAQVE